MSDQDRSQTETAEERALAMLRDAVRPASSDHDRVSAAMIDLFRADGFRLNDLQRTMMRRLLDSIIATIERALNHHLLATEKFADDPEFRASLESDRVAIARPILDRSGVLRDNGLLLALLRRVDEYQISRQLRKDAIATDIDTLDSLVEDADGDVAEAAMALLIAESRRNDRFDAPALPISELPFDVLEAIVWRVAAALRHYGHTEHAIDEAVLDAAIEQAGRAYLDTEVNEPALRDRAIDLAQQLAVRGANSDGMIVDTLNAARPLLYAALLASRTGQNFEDIWGILADANGSRHALVLRLADIGRDAAAHLLMAMARATQSEAANADDSISEWMALFDALSRERASELLNPVSLDSGYRAALSEIANSNAGSLS